MRAVVRRLRAPGATRPSQSHRCAVRRSARPAASGTLAACIESFAAVARRGLVLSAAAAPYACDPASAAATACERIELRGDRVVLRPPAEDDVPRIVDWGSGPSEMPTPNALSVLRAAG